MERFGFCPNCGKQIDRGNQRYCRYCGAALSSASLEDEAAERRWMSSAPVSPLGPPGGTQKRTLTRVVWVGVVLVVVILVIAAIAISLTSRPSPGSGTGGGLTGFKVTGSGCWSGSFGNLGRSSSIDGCGSKDVSWACDGVLVAVVQKDDEGSWTLGVQILLNGRVIQSSSTSAGFGVVTVSTSC